MNSLRKPPSNGFTLVEVLVVLAIMAVLASLSLSVFSRVRESGRATTCQSNLKQIAVAIQQYTQDYSGHFPLNSYPLATPLYTGRYPRTDMYWNETISPYLKVSSIFHCPSNPLDEPTNYSYNVFELNSVAHAPQKNKHWDGVPETQVSFASDVVLNSDSWAIYADGLTATGAPTVTSCGELTMEALHSGGADFSYVDGHVKWLSAAQQGEMHCELQKKRSTRQSNRAQPHN